MSHRTARPRVAPVCLAACLALWGLGTTATAAEAVRIAILPVVVHSATPDPGYVSRGIADMLSARLEQLGGVEIIRVDDPAAATSRLAAALERGRQVGAEYVLYGSFTQFGDGASLDIQCAPLAGSAPDRDRNIFIQAGSIGEIIPKLDTLADKVARFVGGKGAGTPSASAPADTDAMRDLRERLEALEHAVFTPVAGAKAEPTPAPEVPES